MTTVTLSDNSIELKTFLNTCQTGDILLYNSKYWYSRLIEMATGSLFSHIAIILRDPTFINTKLKGLYILESSYEDIPDSNTGKKVWGVQIIPLQHVLDEYKNSYIGNLYYRKLEADKSPKFYTTLTECINHVEGDKYDLNPIDWMKAKYNIQLGDIHKDTTFWCSALVGYVYCCLGYIDKNTPWTILPPKKFSHYENDKLTFTNCVLHPEKCITMT
jgi:hypothetical protein|tara:strand:+ start:14481 stop:15131 length:651 start_codon:yes stop_codon:yes gene_type:complete